MIRQSPYSLGKMLAKQANKDNRCNCAKNIIAQYNNLTEDSTDSPTGLSISDLDNSIITDILVDTIEQSDELTKH